MDPTPHPIRTVAGRAAAAFVAVVVSLVILMTVAPQQTGLIALGQVFLPHLVLVALLVASALALGLRTPAITVALVALLLVAVVRFGSEWVSMPVGESAGDRITLLSWNMQYDAARPDGGSRPILAHEASVVALQELTPGISAVLDGDSGIRARYPYRVLAPDPGVRGLGILSTFPIVDQTLVEEPDAMTVTLDLGSGRRLRVMDTHPFHAHIESANGLPVGYDARDRDASLATIQVRADALLAMGDPVALLGDFNTAPTEPGYDRLTRGFHDVHVEVGAGPGWTWRPDQFEGLGIGLLRIDLALIGPGIEAVGSSVDCGYLGDHCILQATVAVADD